MRGDDLKLPDFLDITREVTKEPYYSMYNLSRKDSSIDVLKNCSSTKVTQRTSLTKSLADVSISGCANGKATNGMPGLADAKENFANCESNGTMMNGHI